ncbi:MAG TPA: hypothetical protein DCL44_01240 [Elusimicrobia bacterium]|nr:hypothetical protein [Elusimicrobiota bacterium]
MKNLASAAGWLLLAAVLAVPSFLFYNWWAKNKEKAALERTQAVSSANVFPAGENTTPVAPGIAASSATNPHKAGPGGTGAAGAMETADRSKNIGQPDSVIDAQAPTQSMPPAGVGGARDIPGQVPHSSVVPASSQDEASVSDGGDRSAAPEGNSLSEVGPGEGQRPAGAAAAVAVPIQPKLTSYFKPKSNRDPTISPMEYNRMKAEANSRIEEERRRLAEMKRRNMETGVENKLRLQGLVGNSVIINNEMYNVGQTVLGAKIIKVGTNYFIGEYKGKQFKKVLK